MSETCRAASGLEHANSTMKTPEHTRAELAAPRFRNTIPAPATRWQEAKPRNAARCLVVRRVPGLGTANSALSAGSPRDGGDCKAALTPAIDREAIETDESASNCRCDPHPGNRYRDIGANNPRLHNKVLPARASARRPVCNLPHRPATKLQTARPADSPQGRLSRKGVLRSPQVWVACRERVAGSPPAVWG